MSLNSVSSTLLSSCESEMNQLLQIWDYMGIDAEEQNNRCQLISNKMKNLLQEHLSEENEYRTQIESMVDQLKKKVFELSTELGCSGNFPAAGLPMFQMYKKLQSRTSELELIKSQRWESFQHYTEGVSYLCQKLAEPCQNEVKEPQQGLPKDNQMLFLENTFNTLLENYKSRLSVYIDVSTDVKRIAEDIQYRGDTDTEKEAISNNQTYASILKDIETGNFNSAPILTPESVEDLKILRSVLVKRKAMLVGTCDDLRNYLRSMWHRLQVPESKQIEVLTSFAGYKPDVLDHLQEEVDKCQHQKWEQMPLYYANLTKEYVDLSRKCFVSNQIEIPQTPSEDMLNKLEQEVERLTDVYSLDKQLYDTVLIYQDMWDAFLVVEAKMKDPAIFSNRGGILLKTEKEKKRLAKELPRIEQEVSEAISRYEEKTKKKFSLYGQTFQDYVQALKVEHKNEQGSSKFKRKTYTDQLSESYKTLSSSVCNSPKRTSFVK